jgi:flagellar biosynthesis GTPase FlhF
MVENVLSDDEVAILEEMVETEGLDSVILTEGPINAIRRWSTHRKVNKAIEAEYNNRRKEREENDRKAAEERAKEREEDERKMNEYKDRYRQAEDRMYEREKELSDHFKFGANTLKAKEAAKKMREAGFSDYYTNSSMEKLSRDFAAYMASNEEDPTYSRMASREAIKARRRKSRRC